MTSHRIALAFILASAVAGCSSSSGTADVAGATVTAHDGWFHVGGYVVVPLDPVPRHRLLRPRPQDSAPDPGPTLALVLGRLEPLRFAVRLAPASGPADAAAVAARLKRR